MKTTQEILIGAKAAAHGLALLSTEQKNMALLAMADALEAHTESILRANAQGNLIFNCVGCRKFLKIR